MRHFLLSVILAGAFLPAAVAQNADDDSLASQHVDSTKRGAVFPLLVTRQRYIEPDTVFRAATNVRKHLNGYNDYRRWMFAAESGAGIRIAQDPANLPDDLAKYRKGLKIGECFGVSASYFFKPNIAVGVNYSFFGLRNSVDYMSYEYPDGNFFEGSRRDKIRVHFLGPMLTIRTMPRKNKVYINYDFAIGYSIFNDNLRHNGTEYDFTSGNGFGFASTVSTDFALTTGLTLGVALKMSAGSAKNPKTTNDKTPETAINNIENLSRITLSLVLKTFW